MSDRKLWKTGLSIGIASEGWFRNGAQSGLDVFEIADFEGYPSIDWENIPKWSSEYGVQVWSYHLPVVWGEEIYHPATFDSEEWKRAYAAYKNWIQHCGEVGVKCMVIHPSIEPYRTPEERENRMQAAIEHLGEVSDLCKKNGLVLAVENLPRTCLGANSDEMLRFMQSNSDLRICFDTNHLLQESHEEFIKKVGKYIITTHVSDYDFIDEKHWFPMQGQVDWRSLQASLEEADYNGPFLYETFPEGITVADVRKNHEILKAL